MAWPLTGSMTLPGLHSQSGDSLHPGQNLRPQPGPLTQVEGAALSPHYVKCRIPDGCAGQPQAEGGQNENHRH